MLLYCNYWVSSIQYWSIIRRRLSMIVIHVMCIFPFEIISMEFLVSSLISQIRRNSSIDSPSQLPQSVNSPQNIKFYYQQLNASCHPKRRKWKEEEKKERKNPRQKLTSGQPAYTIRRLSLLVASSMRAGHRNATQTKSRRCEYEQRAKQPTTMPRVLSSFGRCVVGTEALKELHYCLGCMLCALLPVCRCRCTPRKLMFNTP